MSKTPLEDFIDLSIKMSREHGYNPTTFISMRQRYGTIVAIKRLVESSDIQSGFKKMTAIGLQRYTVEQAVLDHPEHFELKTRAFAKARLELASRDDV